MISLKLPGDEPTSQPRPTKPADLTPVGKVDVDPMAGYSFATIKQQRSDYVSLVLWFVIGLVLGFLIGHHDWKQSSIPDDDQQQQVEPDKKQSDKKIEAAGSTFVFVFEFQTKTAEQQLLLRDMPGWVKLHKCEFRTFDEGSEEAKPYRAAAEKVGIASPFLAVARGRNIVRVFEFPKDRTTLEGLVK